MEEKQDQKPSLNDILLKQAEMNLHLMGAIQAISVFMGASGQATSQIFRELTLLAGEDRFKDLTPIVDNLQEILNETRNTGDHLRLVLKTQAEANNIFSEYLDSQHGEK